MTSSPTTFTSTIERLERLNNTAFGNPRWRVFFTDRVADTKPNASIAHMISNYGPDATDGGRPLVVTLDQHGFIIAATLADPNDPA